MSCVVSRILIGRALQVEYHLVTALGRIFAEPLPAPGFRFATKRILPTGRVLMSAFEALEALDQALRVLEYPPDEEAHQAE